MTLARPPHTLRCAQRGAFLIEAMIAIVVFSVGMLAILGIVGRMNVASSDSRYRVEAAQYAESIVSELRVSDKATRASLFGTSGARFTYWNTRITAAGSLPLVGVAATVKPLVVSFGTATTDGQPVTVTINWRAPQDKDTDSGGTAITHQYVTSTFLQ